MPKISVKDLKLNYALSKSEYVAALKGVNAEFDANKFNCIIGSSGSGKTSLLKCIAGLYPYEGSVLFDGVPVDGVKPADRRLAYGSQEYVLYSHLTVFDNIAFPLKVAGVPKREIVERVKEIADVLELNLCLTRKPRHISGGQQQRVALARALVKRPAVCLLDEPFSNVDPSLRFRERQFLRTVSKRFSLTVVYVTHDEKEATALADKLFVMSEGRIVLSGDPLEVYSSSDPVMAALNAGAKL